MLKGLKRFEKLKHALVETVDKVRHCKTGPSCSKLMMSLVNDSLKFTSSDTQIC